MLFLGVINVASWKGCFTPALRHSPFSSKKNKLASEKIKHHCQPFNPFFSIFFFLTTVPCIVQSSGIHCSFLEEHQMTQMCTFECLLYALSHPHLYVIINHRWINHLKYCLRLSLPSTTIFLPQETWVDNFAKVSFGNKIFYQEVFSEL